MPPIPTLVFSADDRFAGPLLCAAYSCLVNTTAPHVRIFILDNGIQDRAAFEVLHQRYRGRLDLHWVDSRAQTGEAMQHMQGQSMHPWLSGATLTRLFVGHLLPETVRWVLYLDSDVLVLGDVRELFEAVDPATPFQAVVSGLRRWVDRWPAGPWSTEEAQRPYYNAGVLMIDLDAWRQGEIASRSLRCAERQDLGALTLGDQDLLNLVLGPAFTPLDPNWNRAPGHIRSRTGWRLSDVQRALAEGTVRVLHFIGPHKPWNGYYLRPFSPEHILAWWSYSRYRLALHREQWWTTLWEIVATQLQHFGPSLRRSLRYRLGRRAS
ncbi:MAG: glycosyltransferase [Bacteroidota bacterium]